MERRYSSCVLVYRIVLATKVRFTTGKGVNDIGLSRKHIMFGVEQSLKHLQTHYIDLYQVC